VYSKFTYTTRGFNCFSPQFSVLLCVGVQTVLICIYLQVFKDKCAETIMNFFNELWEKCILSSCVMPRSNLSWYAHLDVASAVLWWFSHRWLLVSKISEFYKKYMLYVICFKKSKSASRYVLSGQDRVYSWVEGISVCSYTSVWVLKCWTQSEPCVGGPRYSANLSQDRHHHKIMIKAKRRRYFFRIGKDVGLKVWLTNKHT